VSCAVRKTSTWAFPRRDATPSFETARAPGRLEVNVRIDDGVSHDFELESSPKGTTVPSSNVACTVSLSVAPTEPVRVLDEPTLSLISSTVMAAGVSVTSIATDAFTTPKVHVKTVEPGVEATTMREEGDREDATALLLEENETSE